MTLRYRILPDNGMYGIYDTEKDDIIETYANRKKAEKVMRDLHMDWINNKKSKIIEKFTNN